MKKFLCVLCVLGSLGIQASALDREAFTFTKYDLDVRVEPEQQRLAVRGQIALRNDSKVPQKYIVLQISSSLGWRSIRLGGKAMQFVSQNYTSDIDHTGSLSEAILTLPAEIPPQGTVALEIGYEGTVSLDATRLTRVGVPEDVAKHTDWDQIRPAMTAVRGMGYVAWYPVATEAANLSEGNSLFDTLGRWSAREQNAKMEIKFNYTRDSETGPVLLCNGSPGSTQSERADAAERTTSEFSFLPLAHATPYFALGSYRAIVGPGVTVSYLPEHKTTADMYASAASQVLPYLSDWFGGSSEGIHVIELEDEQASSFESENLLLTPFHTADFKAIQTTVAHQVTHSIFPASRLWIYEGLAHFAQALYREQQDGRQAALDFMMPHGQTLEAAEKRTNDSAGDSLINTFREEFYRTKAMYVWWMLRDMVGEPALKKALANYHPEQDKEPSYVQRLIEAQSKKDLEWFFDDWVYRDRGLPDFHVASVYPRKTLRGIYLVTVTLENLGHAGAEVPITVRFQGGETKARLEVRGDSHASVRVETSALPEEVIVNDGSVPEADLSNNTFKVQIAPEAP
jgi:hypothetical protein